MWTEFRKFISRGNVMDMAVGIMLGVSFSAIVSSLVADVLNPPIGLLLSGVDFSNLFVVIRKGVEAGPYATLNDAKNAGAVTVNYGKFINSIMNFLIIAFTTFMLVSVLGRLKKKDEPAAPTTKECPYCISKIPLAAVKCPGCTSSLG